MNNLKIIIKDKRGGTVILITILIMTSILTVSLSLGNVVINGLRISGDQVNATQAYFAAESGAEEYLWKVRKDGFDPEDTSPDDCVGSGPGTYILNNWNGCNTTLDNLTKFGNPLGLFNYLHYSTSTASTTIKSYGEYRGTRRAVRLMY